MSSDSDEAEQLDSEGEEEEDDEPDTPEELPPRELPQRSTRGQGMQSLLQDEESADEEFWNQDFFAEEDKDVEFEASESEQEDIPDSDFSESEDDEDEDEDAIESRLRQEERGRRKVLKPPGAAGIKRPQPAPRKEATEAPTPSSPTSPSTRAALRVAQLADAVEAPLLRKSTRQRVEEAEKERIRVEQGKPRKKRGGVEHRHLTQEELLAEAAKTEIENLRSLEALQAAEEEVRKRAAVKKARYSGPTVRFHSKCVNGEALTTFEIANMLPPSHMRPQKAPLPAEVARCAVTGQPARYRDPLTRLPFLDVAAFKELRQSGGRRGHARQWQLELPERTWREGVIAAGALADQQRADHPSSVM